MIALCFKETHLFSPFRPMHLKILCGTTGAAPDLKCKAEDQPPP